MGSDIVVHPKNWEADVHASWTAPRDDWGDADGIMLLADEARRERA